MKRLAVVLLPVMLLSLGGCLPDDTFSNILGSSVSEVASIVLSDIVNAVLPPA